MHTGMSRKWPPIWKRDKFTRNVEMHGGHSVFLVLIFFLFPAGILDKKKTRHKMKKKIAELVTRQKRRKIRRKFFLRYLNILKFNAIILICRFYVNVRARPLLSPRKKVKMDLCDWIAHKFNGYNGARGEFAKTYTHMSSKAAEPLIFFGHQNHKHFSPILLPWTTSLHGDRREEHMLLQSFFATQHGVVVERCPKVVCVSEFDRVVQKIKRKSLWIWQTGFKTKLKKVVSHPIPAEQEWVCWLHPNNGKGESQFSLNYSQFSHSVNDFPAERNDKKGGLAGWSM